MPVFETNNGAITATHDSGSSSQRANLQSFPASLTLGVRIPR